MSVPTDVARIPVESANLPARYEAARQALAECTRVDECKDWADKALALASYARQAKDDTLEKQAIRIRARAIRRAGELLRMMNAQGARTDQLPEGDHRKLTQQEAARLAGMSEHQEKQAVRVARVPEGDFEAAVESESPPTLTKLAEAGTRNRHLDPFLSSPKPAGFADATQALGRLRDFARFCSRHEAELVARGVLPHEAEEARQWVASIDGWLDRFVVNLEDLNVLAR